MLLSPAPIYVFLMDNPPRDPERVDTHFGLRDAIVGDILTGRGKGDDFGVKP